MDNNIPVGSIRKRKYFSFEERKKLEKMIHEGISARACGRVLKRSHSTILAELTRKPSYDRYRAAYAHRDFLSKQENKGNIRKLDSSPKLRSLVIEGLLADSSPEQIANRLRLLRDMCQLTVHVSHETIYSFVYSDEEARKLKLHGHLRRGRKKRRKAGVRRAQDKVRISERTSIHERPEYVNTRKEFGHFETDSVIFSKGRNILSVQYERMTGLARLTKLRDKTAPETARALRALVYEFDGVHPVRSVTYDNGTENVLHTELMHRFGVTTYFTDTYSSWQKGGVENLNGLIRQYLPRGIDFESMTDDMIYAIQEKLNNRPRKRLGWLTPNEYYAMKMKRDCTICKPFP